jgi:hypothetical protein
LSDGFDLEIFDEIVITTTNNKDAKETTKTNNKRRRRNIKNGGHVCQLLYINLMGQCGL